MTQLTPRRIEWTPEQIGRFWDWHSSHPATQSLYFSRLAGDALLIETSRYIALQGTAIDVGAGPGYLTEKLVRRGLKTFATDTSAESVATLEARLGKQKNFLGARASTIEHIPFPDGLADLAFVLETMEHLDPQALTSLVGETRRLLKPGGHIVVTTPNQEDLSTLEHFCPNCGSVFHRWQHVRSWSAETLTREMEQFGFEKIVCRATFFGAYSRLLLPLYSFYYMAKQRDLPHLIYIGRKHTALP